jgi:hypothetical protein
MGLDFAIDELYASGWSALDTAGCRYHSDGRPYPTADRVKREFESAGMTLSLRHVQLFNCVRAEWRDRSGAVLGAVVGVSDDEAAVFALSQMRRALVPA